MTVRKSIVSLWWWDGLVSVIFQANLAAHERGNRVFIQLFQLLWPRFIPKRDIYSTSIVNNKQIICNLQSYVAFTEVLKRRYKGFFFCWKSKWVPAQNLIIYVQAWCSSFIPLKLRTTVIAITTLALSRPLDVHLLGKGQINTYFNGTHYNFTTKSLKTLILLAVFQFMHVYNPLIHHYPPQSNLI